MAIWCVRPRWGGGVSQGAGPVEVLAVRPVGQVAEHARRDDGLPDVDLVLIDSPESCVVYGPLHRVTYLHPGEGLVADVHGQVGQGELRAGLYGQAGLLRHLGETRRP